MPDLQTRNKIRSVLNVSVMKFLLIGGISTLLDYIIYSKLSQWLDVTLAKLCSMLCATFFSFLINKIWTFQCQKQSWIVSFVKFYLTQIINIAVNVSVNSLLFWLTENQTAAFIGATVIAMSINFLLQRFYVFRKQSS